MAIPNSILGYDVTSNACLVIDKPIMYILVLTYFESVCENTLKLTKVKNKNIIFIFCLFNLLLVYLFELF
jgi:hypothetical protein